MNTLAVLDTLMAWTGLVLVIVIAAFVLSSYRGDDDNGLM